VSRRLNIGGSLVIAALVVVSRPGRSQDVATGTIVGHVSPDTAGTRSIVGAEIEIAVLKTSVRANSAGDYRIDRVPAGRYLVVVRAIGYTPRADSVTIVAGARVVHDFALNRPPTMLDSLVSSTTPLTATRYISPALRGFEERRKSGFGHFIGEEVLRKHDNSSLAREMGSRIPGLHLVLHRTHTHIHSTRGAANFSTLPQAEPRQSGSPRGCWLNVFVDGARIYTTGNGDAPDFARLPVNEYAGVEYYAGGATIPPQYNSTNPYSCGTLLLWTRER
jgi:hypothetical protein